MEQLQGVSPQMRTKILNYVATKARTPEERQAMIDDMLPEAIEYEKQQKIKTERNIIKTQLREKISKETRREQAQQLQFSLRSAILSDMVRDYAGKSGGNVKGLDNDEDLLNAFLAKNPHQAKAVESYLNGKMTNIDIGKRMGFISYNESPEMAGIDEEIETPGFWRQVGQVGKDVFGAVGDSIRGVGDFAGKYLAKGIGRGAKKLWADEGKVDALVDDFIEYQENFNDIGQDKNSLTYGIVNNTADIAQIATPGGSTKIIGKWLQMLDKGLKITQKVPQLVKVLEKGGAVAEQISKKAPLLTKILKGGVEGAGDTVLFNIVNGEGTDASEMGLGGAIGGTFPVAGKAFNWLKNKAKNLIGSTASKLELNGIINPAKLKKVQDQLLQEGASFPWNASPEDVGKWMLERGFKGDKGEIVDQLSIHAQKSKQLVDEVLSLSDSVHKVDEVNEALEMLYKDYSTRPWLKQRADEIVELIKDEHTLAEINQVKRYMDEAYNMFKQSGGESAGLTAEGLRNIRKTLKTKIEEVAEQEGLWNIKMLNNETQIARGLMDGITRKDTADTVREFLSPFSSMRNGAVLWWFGADFSDDGSINFWNLGGMAKGALLWAIIGNTKVKTTLANMLKKLGGIEKKEITQWIATNGASKLSKKSAQSLAPILNKVIEEWDGDIDDLIMKAQDTTPKTFGNFKDIDIKNKNEAFGRFTASILKEKTASWLSRHTQEKMGILDQALKRYWHKWVKSEDFGASYLLPEILDDPKLYEKYPQLKETQIIFADFHTTKKRGLQAWGSIFINSKLYEKDPANLRSTIVHEIQHIKQDIKGMPKLYDEADVRKLDKRYIDDPREIDARRKQQEYLDFVQSQKNIEETDIIFDITQDIYREVDNRNYKNIDTIFEKFDKQAKKGKLSENTIKALEKVKEEVYTLDEYQRVFFEQQSRKLMYNDEYWKVYEGLKKEAQLIEATEQRIGKVWKNKVGKEYSNIQKKEREKKKEALIERIGEELWIDQFSAKDIYDSMI